MSENHINLIETESQFNVGKIPFVTMVEDTDKILWTNDIIACTKESNPEFIKFAANYTNNEEYLTKEDAANITSIGYTINKDITYSIKNQYLPLYFNKIFETEDYKQEITNFIQDNLNSKETGNTLLTIKDNTATYYTLVKETACICDLVKQMQDNKFFSKSLVYHYPNLEGYWVVKDKKYVGWIPITGEVLNQDSFSYPLLTFNKTSGAEWLCGTEEFLLEMLEQDYIIVFNGQEHTVNVNETTGLDKCVTAHELKYFNVDIKPRTFTSKDYKILPYTNRAEVVLDSFFKETSESTYQILDSTGSAVIKDKVLTLTNNNTICSVTVSHNDGTSTDLKTFNFKVEEFPEPQYTSYELSQETSSTTDGAIVWTFDTGVIIKSTTNDRGYATGLHNTLKFSKNYEYILETPKPFNMITFRGYNNTADIVSNIKFTNNSLLKPTDLTFTGDISEKTCVLTIPTRSLKFVCENAQTCLEIHVSGGGEWFKEEYNSAQGYINWVSTDATSNTLSTYTHINRTLGKNIILNGDRVINSETFAQFGSNIKNENSANNDNAIKFNINPISSYWKFKPTRITFKASRIGTSGGVLDLKLMNGTKEVKIVTDLNPKRNNAEQGYWSEYAFDIHDVDFAYTNQIIFNLYSLDIGKSMGLSNIKVECEGKYEVREGYLNVWATKYDISDVKNVDVSIEGDILNTICVPFDISTELCNDFIIEEFIGISNDVILTQRVPNIKAGVPYFWKQDDGTYTEGYSFQGDLLPINPKTITFPGGSFVGTYNPIILNGETVQGFSGTIVSDKKLRRENPSWFKENLREATLNVENLNGKIFEEANNLEKLILTDTVKSVKNLNNSNVELIMLSKTKVVLTNVNVKHIYVPMELLDAYASTYRNIKFIGACL